MDKGAALVFAYLFCFLSAPVVPHSAGQPLPLLSVLLRAALSKQAVEGRSLPAPNIIKGQGRAGSRGAQQPSSQAAFICKLPYMFLLFQQT